MNYDNYVEKVCDEIEAGNDALDEFLSSDEATRIFQLYYNEYDDYTKESYVFIAEKLKDAFLKLHD